MWGYNDKIYTLEDWVKKQVFEMMMQSVQPGLKAETKEVRKGEIIGKNEKRTTKNKKSKRKT